MSPLHALPIAFLGLLNPLVPASWPTATQDSPALGRGLEALRLESIEADLDYLASPERGGRSTPSAGLEQALAHVVQRLEDSDWTPGGSRGWRSPFPLFTLGVDGARSGARVIAPDEIDDGAAADVLLGLSRYAVIDGGDQVVGERGLMHPYKIGRAHV